MRYRSRWKKMAENQPGDMYSSRNIKLERQLKASKTVKVCWCQANVKWTLLERDLVVMINDISTFDLPVRRDNAEQKRIELHAHTQMSNMDATVSASDLIQQAAKWGIRPSPLPIVV